jgi:hypothetical protein
VAGHPRSAGGQRIERALQHLELAMGEYDTARIARELARLGKAGAKPELALARVIQSTHARLRDGMTHAYAAADAWLRLRDGLTGEAPRLACVTEALAYIAFDTLREKTYPFTEERTPWSAKAFAAAVESQDENRAAALLNGAFAQGLHFADLEPAMAAAALAHYNDIGHTLIYLMHVRRLIERSGVKVEQPLLLAWLRSLILATREDLLPDFRRYADALATWRNRTQQSVRSEHLDFVQDRLVEGRVRDVRGSTSSPRTEVRSVRPEPFDFAQDRPVEGRSVTTPGPDAFEGKSVRHVLEATVAAAGNAPLDVYFALMEAAARHLLRFEERHALRTDNSVADNVGWLDFTHALTFGHALRQQCARDPQLWPQGLLQLALFVGRNSGYLDPNMAAQTAIREWAVTDETAFHERAIATIVDHGLGLPIFPAHLLKTWSAVRDEVAAGLPAGARTAMLAAVNRLLAVRFKQRHALRTAHQALGFVAKED